MVTRGSIAGDQLKLIYWDEKYWYTEHKFVVADRVCAAVQVRGAFVNDRKVVSMHNVVTLADENVTSPEKPVNVEHWQSLIDAKKIS